MYYTKKGIPPVVLKDPGDIHSEKVINSFLVFSRIRTEYSAFSPNAGM